MSQHFSQEMLKQLDDMDYKSSHGNRITPPWIINHHARCPPDNYSPDN